MNIDARSPWLVIGLALTLTLTACGGGGGGSGSQSQTGTDTSGATGSTGATEPAVEGTPTRESTPPFTVGPFTAQYYSEDDGTTQGVGNDGSDTSIIPVFVSQETTDGVALNYSGSDLDGIDAHNLYATWEGTLSVTRAGTVDINFDLTDANVDVDLDGVLTQEWRNGNRTLRVTLNEGDHALQVSYHNHASSALFNLSFTRYSTAKVGTGYPVVSQLVSDTTKIVYIGANGSDDFYNALSIDLPAYDHDILLVVSSFHAMSITLNNPHNTTLAGVLMNSTQPLSTVTGYGDAALYNVRNLSYAYSDFTTINNELTQLTGRPADVTLGNATLHAITVPAF